MGHRRKVRERCEQCQRPVDMCPCAQLPRIDVQTRVVLVMHCREAATTTATGPLALAALAHHERHLHGVRGRPLDLSHLHRQERRVLILFPDEDAQELSAEFLAADLRPVTLIVPDGSWRQARRASRRVPGLDSAERVTLPPGESSTWGLRRETQAAGLSTFEAIARSLGIIEGAPIQQQLEAVFEQEITRQRRQQPHRAPPLANFEAETPLTVLHQDEQLVVVDKPSGYLVHRGWAQEGPVVLQLLRDQLGRHLYPVHRLDRATSGALLFGLSSAAAAHLQAQFEAGQVDKRYLALCRGCDPQLREVDHPLSKEPGAGERKPARTLFRLLGSSGRYGLYEARPVTGRAHQIRRHLKRASHPIIGDVRYGKGEHNRLFRERYGFHRLALHCSEMSFDHPTSGARITVQAPLSSDFGRMLLRLGIEQAPQRAR